MKLELDIDLKLDKEQMAFLTEAIHQIIKSEVRKEVRKQVSKAMLKKELT